MKENHSDPADPQPDALKGNRAETEAAVRELYPELRRIAAARLRGFPSGFTLQATAMVNELYLRLIHQSHPGIGNRVEFLKYAATALRTILLDHLRAKNAGKRPDGRMRVEIDDALRCTPARSVDLVALDRALTELARIHPLKALIIEMKYFAGCTDQEIAEAVGIGVAGVTRHCRWARGWLRQKMIEG